MYSKVKIFGHPIHPMLVAYPVAFYTATLICYIVYSSKGDTFWFKVAVTANIAGVVMAALAAIPGFIDWLNIPADSRAKKTGLFHLLCNIISDLIQGVENKWADLYSPKRTPLKVPKTYLSEVFNMVKQYGDYITKADINEVEELKKGEGAILAKGIKRIAVYRDDGNKVHAFSAICPHMGCVLKWNAEEKSFDCSCHGSRFTKEGIVINGPATVALERIHIKK